MKVSNLIIQGVLFVVAAVASPVASPSASPIEKAAAQSTRVTSTANELMDNPIGGDKCPAVLVLFAGELEGEGNMGIGCGRLTAEGIKHSFGGGRVVVQGIEMGPEISDNVDAWKSSAMIHGTSKMLEHCRFSSILCPDAKIIVGGQGLGSGITDATVSQLEPDILTHVVAAFMYGMDDYWDYKGNIYGYPVEQTRLVHEDDPLKRWYPDNNYDNFGPYVPDMVEWLVERLRCANVPLGNETDWKPQPLDFIKPNGEHW